MTAATQNPITELTKVEALELLKSDTPLWNKLYREARSASGWRAYLGGAYLGGADLGGADLGGADLGGAYLRRADLGGADLGGAYLGGAYLGGADLGGADLGGADLRRADLRRAYLGGADLGGAYLRRAYLRGADLGGADLRRAYLRGAYLGGDHPEALEQFRIDVFDILDHAPNDVAALRAAILKGKINGSTYRDRISGCQCLCGTIAVAHDEVAVDNDSVESVCRSLGIVPSAFRPAEQWFTPIGEGDRPIDFDPAADNTDAFPSEGVFRISWALRWVDEWTASRTAIAKALGGKAS